MNSKTPLIVLLALAGSAAAGLAQARGQQDVQWAVTIGSGVGGQVYMPAQSVYVQPQPVYVQPEPVYWPAPPVYVRPLPMARTVYYRQPTRWDRDGDGIPNRYDRVYNPRWDVDGDGTPNWAERSNHTRRDGDGIPNRHDPRRGDNWRGGGR